MKDGLFHAIDPTDDFFCHNIKLSAGRLTAMSFLRDACPQLGGARSPYEGRSQELEKENFFESIRAREFVTAPSRMGAVFLFDSKEVADRANASWWKNQRVILLACVIEASRQGSFDAKLLDSPSERWAESARSYWSGACTNNPQIEVLVDGVVQLNGWESFGKLLR